MEGSTGAAYDNLHIIFMGIFDVNGVVFYW